MNKRLIYLLTIIHLYISGNEVHSKSIFQSGVSDFSKVVKFKGFVDKSMLIFDIFSYRLSHITAPRLCGKSTNIDMFRRFVEVPIDENGNRKEVTSTENYKIFKENHLLITKDEKFFNKHFGKFPVVFMDLEVLKNPGDFNKVVRNFENIIKTLYGKNEFLLRNSTLFRKEEDKESFKKYLDGSGSIKTAKEVTAALNLLTKYLHRHFNKDVFLLIDNYDSHVLNLMFNKNPDADQIITFIHDIFEKFAFDNDDYVFGTFVTGELRASILKTTSDYHHFGFLQDNDFTKYYGLELSEINSLVKNLVRDADREKVTDTITSFYGSYGIVEQDIKIFSIYSVLSYLDNLHSSKDPKAYWCGHDYFEIFQKLFGLKTFSGVVDRLVSNKTVNFRVDKPFYKENIVTLSSALSAEEDKADPKLLQITFNLLYHLGFLSITPDCIVVRNKIDAYVPNKEIQVTLLKMLEDERIRRKEKKTNV